MASRGLSPVGRIDAMPSRVMALLLCFVLLWTSLGVSAAPPAAAPDCAAPGHAILEAADLAVPDDGAPTYPRVDGLPSPVLGDASAETPGLLPTPPTTRDQSLVMAPPRPRLSLGTPTPFLAGPLRPPCGVSFAG